MINKSSLKNEIRIERIYFDGIDSIQLAGVDKDFVIHLYNDLINNLVIFQTRQSLRFKDNEYICYNNGS